MREEFVETTAGRVRLMRTGPEGGPAGIVCWPGLGLTAEEFARLGRDGAARGLAVAALDPPGHGRSDPAPDIAWPDAACVLGAVAERVGADRYALVGHSSGAVASVMAARALGGRLRALVVADGALDRPFTGRSDAELEALNRAYFETLRLPDWPAALARARADLRAWDTDVELGVRALFAPAPQGGLVGRGDLATITRWASLVRDYTPLTAPWPDVPILALYADSREPPATLAELGARLPRLRAKALPGAGHELFWDKPEAASNAVLAFATEHLGP